MSEQGSTAGKTSSEAKTVALAKQREQIRKVVERAIRHKQPPFDEATFEKWACAKTETKDQWSEDDVDIAV